MKPPVFNPAWSDEVQRLYAHDMEEIWDPKIAPHMFLRYQNLLDFYLSLVDSEPKLDILDVGCAQATLAILLAERGHDVTAVDIRPDFLEYAAARHTHGTIRFVAGNPFEESLVNDQYDLVFANQIIEHVLEPVEKVRILAKSLKDGGRLVMTTPNFSYFINRLPTYTEFVQKGIPFDENSADSDGHAFAFVLSEFEHQFELAGLEVISAGYLETPLTNGHVKVRHLIPLLPRRFWRTIDAALLRIKGLNRYLAHQLYVVARKTAKVE